MNKENKVAVIAYTTFSTDTRVQKEAYAAKEAGYDLDIYTLDDSRVSDYNIFNFIRSNIVQYKGHSKFNYIFSYFKFFVYCLFSLSWNYPKCKYKYIHVHNMPNFLVFSAFIPKLFGSKVILDVHDLMPEIFSVKFKLSINHLLIKLLYFEERIASKFANEIIATNSFHVNRFKENGLNNKRVTEVVNVADEKVFYPPQNKEYFQDKLIIAYPSTLAKRLGIDNLIEAIEILKNRGVSCLLKIYGDGEYRDQISKIVKDKNLSEYIKLSNSFISLEELSKELNNALIGVIPLPSNVSNDIAMPVKIYEFFAKKVCVVATELPLLKECFDGSVMFFNESNSVDLADKIEYLNNNRDILKSISESGYNQFSNRTWDFYKDKYKSLII